MEIQSDNRQWKLRDFWDQARTRDIPRRQKRDWIRHKRGREYALTYSGASTPGQPMSKPLSVPATSLQNQTSRNRTRWDAVLIPKTAMGDQMPEASEPFAGGGSASDTTGPHPPPKASRRDAKFPASALHRVHADSNPSFFLEFTLPGSVPHSQNPSDFEIATFEICAVLGP